MQEHMHTGFAAFLFAGISAVVFIQLTRLAAAQLVKPGSPAFAESTGKVLGSLVHFG